MTRAIASNQVLLDGELVPATLVLCLDSGKIVHIAREVLKEDSPELKQYNVTQYADVSPQVVMPGVVDAHVHLNEPGRTEWEGFATGTQAAASGGVTTVIDMPLNAIPPTTTVANFEAKLDAAHGQTWVDVGFWGGLVPDNLDDLLPLINMGVRGFKGFLCPSGVDEFPNIDPAYIEKALVKVRGAPTLLMFHAEMEPHDFDAAAVEKLDHSKYSSFLASRPDNFETLAISKIIECSEKTPDVPVHIVHLATQEAVPMLREAQKKGLPVSAETCFHYLSLSAEHIENCCTHFKCCPPIRSEKNRQNLWKALHEGVVSSVVSDHSPCTPDLKGVGHLDFFKAWGGISSVGLGLPILHTEGLKQSPSVSLAQISKWCSQNTAKQVGLDHRKGQFAVGMDADVLVFDPKKEWTIENKDVLFKNKLTAYDGMKFTGQVVETVVRGQTVFKTGDGISEKPLGELLLEPRK
ncbi:allantoinase [Diutina catenulata]